MEIVELEMKVVTVEYAKIRPVKQLSKCLEQACRVKSLQGS